MNAIAGIRPAAVRRAGAKAVRKALPGPWRPRRLVAEIGGALLLGALAALFEVVSRSGLAAVVGPAVALLFLLRRGLPATVLVLTAAGSGGAGGPLLLLVCAGWSAGARVTRVVTLVCSFTGAFALMTVIGLVKDAGAVPSKLLLGLSLGSFLLLAVLPALWGRYRAQRRALLDALRERNVQLLRERAMIAHQARLRERHRIAQDMHDSLGHQLALISVHSGALEVDRTLTDRQREAVGVLRLAAVAAMRELREVVGVLHDESTASAPGAGAPAVPGTGAAGVAVGGVNGIERLVASSRAAGTAVTLGQDGERRPMTAAVDHAAYRIVQEALTNAHKHAPGAPITVALRYEPDALVVEVANAPAPVPVGAGADGGGTDGGAGTRVVVSGGQGLTGLRERARLVGGMVHAGPTPDTGFRLAAVLPYGGSPDGAAAGDGDGDGDGDGEPAYGGGALVVGGAASGGGALAGGVATPVRSEEPGFGVWDRTAADTGARAARGRRISPAVGCAVGGLIVLFTVLGLLVWGVVALVRTTTDATVEKSVYDSIAVGEPEAQVRRRLPAGNSFFTRDLEKAGPTPPAGSSCVWFLSGETAESWGQDNAARFCFKDGVLVEKQHYLVKM
ncbi:sensor histidine kinase [Kitasatospora sp. NPDC004240]